MELNAAHRDIKPSHMSRVTIRFERAIDRASSTTRLNDEIDILY